MESKLAEFNGYKIELKKMRMKDANVIFPFVMAAMTKISFGNYNFFTDLKPHEIELFQEKICENCIKHAEKKNEDGSITVIKKNLTLSDLDEYLEGFLPLLILFLEFNFGFFSQAQTMLYPILVKASLSEGK